MSQNGIEQQSVGEFSERAYLDYSMYVILDRALPICWRWSQTSPEKNHLCDE